MGTKHGRPYKDQQDIERTLKGDMKAFSLLVDRYKHMVYTLAMRMLRNRELAEEVSQDTFIKAYRALAGFSGKSAFSTWLYKIAYNQCLDYLKKRQGSPEMMSPDPEILKHRSLVPEVESKMESDDLKAMVRQGMDALSPDDSLIITLYYLEEQSLDEISHIMGISTNTAKVRLHRSRQRLAEIMKPKVGYYKTHGYG